MKKRKVEFVSPKTVKKFLEENNVNLDSLGGEKEQEDFISRLSDALIKFRKINSAKDISKIEKASRLESAGQDVLKVLQEVNIPVDIINKLSENFIPQPTPTKVDIDEIKDLKEKVAHEKTADDEQEQSEEKETTENSEEYSEATSHKKDDDIIDVEYREVTSDEETQKQDEVEVEGSVFDKRDETASEIFRDMLDKHRELREQKKELKKLNSSIRTERTIGEGVTNILRWSRDVMVCNVLYGGISNLDHDIIAGGAFIALTGVAVTGYVGARVAGKAIKGVAKLGFKAAKFAGKAIFKAAKGTAKICKAKADKNREKRRLKQIDRTDEALKEADNATLQILEYSKRRLRANEILEEEYEDYGFSEEQLQYISDIRDEEKREETEDKILEENEELLTEAKKKIAEISLIGITKDFQEKLGIENPEEIRRIIDSVTMDENGQLVLGEDSPVSMEDIESAGLYDKFINIVNLPKINEMSFEDIRDIVDLSDSEIDIDEDITDFWLGKDYIDYVKVIRDVIQESRANGEEISLDSINENIQTISNNNYILREAYDRDLVSVAKDLRDQVKGLSKEFEGLREGKTSKDNRRRETLRKIAKAKVADLEKSEIIEIIKKGDEKEVSILGQAKDALSQDLAQDLEHTADIKRGKIDYEQETDEHEEK